MIISLVAMLVVIAFVGLGVWSARLKTQVEVGLRSLTDEELDRLYRSALDGRQYGWVNAERRRRGIA